MKKIILLFFIFNLFSQENDFLKVAKNWHKVHFLKLRNGQRVHVKNWLLHRIDKAHKIFSESNVELLALANFFKADDQQRSIQRQMDHDAGESTKYINKVSISIYNQMIVQKLKNCYFAEEYSLAFKVAQIEVIKIILKYYDALLFAINSIQSKL